MAEDVRFVGGEYGIWTGTPSPGWQYTLLDAHFAGQRRAAIREQAATSSGPSACSAPGRASACT